MDTSPEKPNGGENGTKGTKKGANNDNTRQKVIEIVTVIGGAAIIAILMKLILFNLLGASLVIIENGPNSSMEPTYYKGDLFVLTKPDASEFERGDIMVYENAKNELIIHRIVDIKEVNGTTYFRVSGDNPTRNNNIDPFTTEIGISWIPYSSTVGRALFFIPSIGYLSLWMSPDEDGSGGGAARIVYFGLIIAAVALLVWPGSDEEEKEKEEEEQQEQKEEVNSAKIPEEEGMENGEDSVSVVTEDTNVTKGSGKSNPSLVDKLRRFSDPDNFKTLGRREQIGIVAVGIMLILLLPIALDYLNFHPSMETEMTGVGLWVDPFDSVDGEHVVFARFTFTQDGSWRHSIQDVEVKLIQDGTVLGRYVWHAFYEMEGEYMVGVAIIYDPSEAQLGQSAQLVAIGDVHVRLGGDYQSETSTDIVLPDAP